MKYLLDTNILSELRKQRPQAKVVNFVNSISRPNLYISSITIGEIQKGIDACTNNALKTDLNKWLESDLIDGFKEQILYIDNKICLRWGKLMAEVKNLPVIDSLIASTCLANNLILVTRNIKDFAKIKKLELINPFEKNL